MLRFCHTTKDKEPKMTNTISDYVDYLIFARRNSFALGPVCETVVKLVAATKLPAVEQAKLLREIDGEFTKRLRADGVAESALAPVGQTRNLLRDAAEETATTCVAGQRGECARCSTPTT